ncbi:MAG TPA: hypothetical protein PLN48_16010 [Lachnospiraceae bacterium]|nr:hypothetical protein [Lachnospiraceae bacterium]
MDFSLKKFFSKKPEEFETSKTIEKQDHRLSHESIVGNIIAPAENEVPVRQYDIARYRYYLRMLFAQGQLEVTNKRIIYRVTGTSFFGPILYHNEYDINHISGINIESGRRICIPYFILSLLVIGPLLIFIDTLLFGLFSTLLAGNGQQEPNIAACIAGAAVLLFLCFMTTRHRRIQYLILQLFFTLCVLGSGFNTAFSRGFDELYKLGVFPAIIGGIVEFFSTGPLQVLFLFIPLIIAIIGCYNFSMRQNISISIISDNASGLPINVANTKSLLISTSTVTIFGSDAKDAVMELGALIRDIKDLGSEAAIRKWKDIDPDDWRKLNRMYREKSSEAPLNATVRN